MSNSSFRTLTWFPLHHLGTTPRSDWLVEPIWFRLVEPIWFRCEDHAGVMYWASATVLAWGWKQAHWHLCEPWSHWVREKTSHPQGDDETNGWKCQMEMHSTAQCWGDSRGHAHCSHLLWVQSGPLTHCQSQNHIP